MNEKQNIIYRGKNTLSVENVDKLFNLRENISKNTALVSEQWLDKLILWANEKNIPTKGELYQCPLWTKECEVEAFYQDCLIRDKEKLRNLKGVFFQSYICDDLPEEFGNLAQLEFVYFEGLANFPRSILKLEKLKWLGLTGNDDETSLFYHIEEFVVPKELSKLSNLIILDLQGNYLRRFPKSILKLEKLYGLDLKYCGLSSIPRGFQVLSSHIGVVILNGNPLKNIPRSLCQCKKLWWLGLSDCALRSLPHRFANLHNLQELYLKYNDFSEFPQVLFKLKNLKKLVIDKHLITPDIAKQLKDKGIEYE